MSCIVFTVNGIKCSVDSRLYRETSLYAYLRYCLGLPGTKAMCKQGVCGACIVTVRAHRETSGTVETFSANSCLVLVFSCHGWDITTIEGLGSRRKGYNDIQKRIAAMNGTQCGFCTPGWVMQINTLRDKNLTMAELENSFGSNTCRCTGYRPILDTIKTFATNASPNLCGKIKDIEDMENCKVACERKCSFDSINSDWTLIEEIKLEDIITLKFGKTFFVQVFEEDQIFETITRYKNVSYMLIDGDTSKGVFEDFVHPLLLINISKVSSLKEYSVDQNLVLGANISLEDCIEIFKSVYKTNEEFPYLEDFVKHFQLIAHYSVRKIGSLAGNLMIKHVNPSYQSDVFVLFESVGATITIRNSRGKKVTLSLTKFLKYNMQGNLILNFKLPPQSSSEHIYKSYKIMPRSQNALAIVNAAFNLKIDKKTNKIESATMVYGNISKCFIHAFKTEHYLKGKYVFDNTTLQEAIKILDNELVPEDKPPKDSPESRKKLAVGLFYKFILSTSPPEMVSPLYESGGTLITRPVSSGVQSFQTNPTLYPLNQPIQKLEAAIQSSGEAEYVNDIPPMLNEVFAAFVLSTVYNGEISNIDASEVLKIKGVIAVYTAKDFPGINSFGFPGYQLQIENEEILADKNINYYGQPVAIVVADSEILANKVATKVKVTYVNVSAAPPVLTINEGKKIKKNLFTGDVIVPKKKGDNVTKVVKGVYEIGAQYHYYLEPLSCVVVPVDEGLEVYDATQWIDLTQTTIAQSLNMKESEVVVKVRRIGGGFGGKLSRNAQVATSCALVAKTLDRPCRFILPLQTNLTIAGRRLPCQCSYEVGVDDDGKIQYLDAEIYEDDGCSHNENLLAYTAEGFPNCYDRDYINLKTFSVLTNLPSNTFARAPGTMEGLTCIEQIMEHIAFEVQKDPTEVRLLNMRKEDNDLPTLIEVAKKDADYEDRLDKVKQFNDENRWQKKAIQVSVMLFPVIYFGNYSAMISIYRGDGSVTVSTGGIEMGQGVNTKAAQVCAYELGIPIDFVKIIPSYSFIATNNIFSGSSIVSESVCYAIIKACDTIKSRLQPIKDGLENPTWTQLIKKAGEEEVDLTAIYMMNDKEPDLQGYSAFAVTISEITLDILTGKFQVERVDILEDVGLSANPAVDIGQVEGAYVQGLSYFTTEKFIYDLKTGKLLTNDALKYDVYLAKDIPVDFRVTLRYNSGNPKGVLGSKAVGEMGICTAHGVTHALRQCIMESRKDSGYERQWIDIETPFTTDSILKALNVDIKEFVLH